MEEKRKDFNITDAEYVDLPMIPLRGLSAVSYTHLTLPTKA